MRSGPSAGPGRRRSGGRAGGRYPAGEFSRPRAGEEKSIGARPVAENWVSPPSSVNLLDSSQDRGRRSDTSCAARKAAGGGAVSREAPRLPWFSGVVACLPPQVLLHQGPLAARRGAFFWRARHGHRLGGGSPPLSRSQRGKGSARAEGRPTVWRKRGTNPQADGQGWYMPAVGSAAGSLRRESGRGWRSPRPVVLWGTSALQAAHQRILSRTPLSAAESPVRGTPSTAITTPWFWISPPAQERASSVMSSRTSPPWRS